MCPCFEQVCSNYVLFPTLIAHKLNHSYDILGARMLWKLKEARILKKIIDQPV